MKTYYVYILKCADTSYYTGITSNLYRRLNEHNNDINTNSYVNKRKPFKLVFIAIFDNLVSAIEREKQIKGWSRRKKEALIDSNWQDLLLFSKKHGK